MTAEPALRIRDDVFYAPSPTGVHVLSARGELSIAGDSIAAWLDRLAPHLDGSATLTDLTRQLAPDRRAHVESIVTSLSARGIIESVVPQSQPQPQHVGLDGLRILIVGSGVLRQALHHACCLAGASHIDLMTDAVADGVPQAVSTADIVIHLHGPRSDAQARQMVAWCSERACLLQQILVLGDQVWIRPAHHPASDRHGSALVGDRLRGWAISAGTRAWSLDATDLTLVANQAVQALVHFRAGEPGTTAGVVTRYDGATSATFRHRVAPAIQHATRSVGEVVPFADRIASLETTPELTDEEFSRRAFRLCDSRTGIFGELTEGDLAQSPLQIATTEVADPAGRGRITRVYGVGFDVAEARYAASLRAICSYAARSIDPGRVEQGMVSAWHLGAGRESQVAAAVAFPVLTDQSRLVVPVGAVAARSWSGAVEQALLAHIRRLTVTELMHDPRPLSVIDPFGAHPDSRADYCLQMLDATGVSVQTADATGRFGVPVIACALDGRLVAYGVGTTHASALTDALVTALLHRQSTITGQPVYAPAPVPQVPLIDAGQAAAYGCPELSIPDLVARLRAHDLDALVVPLDHDPGIRDLLPFVVNVVVRAHEHDR